MGEIDKKNLVCEPVRRPDGEIVWIGRFSGENHRRHFDNVLVKIHGDSYYEVSEVSLLGGGSFQHGIDVLGRAYYTASLEDLLIGRRRLFHDVIKELKELQEHPEG